MNLRFLYFLLLTPIIAGFYSQNDDIIFAAAPIAVELEFYWESPPIIRVCSDSSISTSRVRRAIDYWRKIGYEFRPTIFDEGTPACVSSPNFGEIIITIPDQSFDFSKIAGTRCATIGSTLEVAYAKIYIPEKHINKQRVLEHEIGHALGWLHSDEAYHIMNKGWESGGHRSSGLSPSLYSAAIKKLRFRY